MPLVDQKPLTEVLRWESEETLKKECWSWSLPYFFSHYPTVR